MDGENNKNYQSSTISSGKSSLVIEKTSSILDFSLISIDHVNVNNKQNFDIFEDVLKKDFNE